MKVGTLILTALLTALPASMALANPYQPLTKTYTASATNKNQFSACQQARSNAITVLMQPGYRAPSAGGCQCTRMELPKWSSRSTRRDFTFTCTVTARATKNPYAQKPAYPY